METDGKNSDGSGKFWFYSREQYEGPYQRRGLHYSQIIECERRVGLPGYFSQSDAVGPFDSILEAATVRKIELETALDAGKKIYQQNVSCGSPW